MATYMAQVALLTPLMETGAIDEESVERLVHHVLQTPGVDLSILGSTGEGAHLDFKHRQHLRNLVAQLSRGKAMVFSGVIGGTPNDVIEEIEAIAAINSNVGDTIGGVLVPPPFYYYLNPDEILAYYRFLANNSKLPIILYNIPQFTKVSIPPGVVHQLVREHAIFGIKDSSRDFEYFQQLVDAVQYSALQVLTGSDSLLMSALLMGGHGIIGAAANIVPDWVSEVLTAAVSHDWDTALEWQRKIDRLVSACRINGDVSAWKYVASEMGLCQNYMAFPAEPIDPADEQAKQLRMVLKDLSLIPG